MLTRAVDIAGIKVWQMHLESVFQLHNKSRLYQYKKGIIQHTGMYRYRYFMTLIFLPREKK